MGGEENKRSFEFGFYDEDRVSLIGCRTVSQMYDVCYLVLLLLLVLKERSETKNIVASEVHLHAFLCPHKGFLLLTAFSNRGLSNSNAFE